MVLRGFLKHVFMAKCSSCHEPAEVTCWTSKKLTQTFLRQGTDFNKLLITHQKAPEYSTAMQE